MEYLLYANNQIEIIIGWVEGIKYFLKDGTGPEGLVPRGLDSQSKGPGFDSPMSTALPFGLLEQGSPQTITVT